MSLNPNKVISQVDIEQEIVRLTVMLETETDAFGILAEDYAKKDARFKKEWAQEYLSANGNIKERESWADYKQADAMFEMKIAEALLKAKREKLTSIRTSLDSLRTLAANLRIQT